MTVFPFNLFVRVGMMAENTSLGEIADTLYGRWNYPDL
jgi:hypothetical protein